METALLESAHKVEFEESTHTYRVRGVRFPSVTQIIADVGLYGDTSYFTEYSRERGVFAHKVIQWHLSGELDEASIDPAILPYFKAWLRFEKEAAYVSDECEKMLISDFHRFAGTVDHIGHLNGFFCLIDVKTSATVNPSWGIQLAGYEILMKRPGIKRFSLQLTGEGKYKLTEHRDRSDRNIFLAALSLFYWKANNLKG